MAKKSDSAGTKKEQAGKESKAKPSKADVKKANNAADIEGMFPAEGVMAHSNGNVVEQQPVTSFKIEEDRGGDTPGTERPAEPSKSRKGVSAKSGGVSIGETDSEPKEVHSLEEHIAPVEEVNVVASVAPVEEAAPVAPVEEIAPIENTIVTEPEKAPVETQTEPSASENPTVKEETAPVIPTQEQLEEKVIENWWNSRNRPSDINHFELAYSSGINMDKFSNLEARVGKFKFSRTFVGSNWQITVDEK